MTPHARYYWRAERSYMGQCYTALPRRPANQSVQELQAVLPLSGERVHKLKRICLARSPRECLRALGWVNSPKVAYLYRVEGAEDLAHITRFEWIPKTILPDEWPHTHEAWALKPITLSFRYAVAVSWPEGEYTSPTLVKVAS